MVYNYFFRHIPQDRINVIFEIGANDGSDSEILYNHFKPKKASLLPTDEPTAYSFNGNSMCGVMSENFSFYDMNSDELLAKGNGGQRQMFHYTSMTDSENTNIIDTPPDTYTPEKGEGNDMDKLVQEREKDVRVSHPPVI